MPRLIEFTLNHWDLLLALVIIVLMLFGGPVLRKMRGYLEVDPLGAVELMNHREALYLDVREPNEYNDGAVLNSRHIPLRELHSRLSELEEYKNHPIIVGCRSGNRSAVACGALRKAQFAEVYNLQGGILAWQSAGLPLDNNNKKRKKR